MRAGSKAFGPADGASAVRRRRKARAVRLQPRIVDEPVVFKAIELQGAEDIEAEFTQYGFKTPLGFGPHDPLKPRRYRRIGGQTFTQRRLPERRWPIDADNAPHAVRMP